MQGRGILLHGNPLRPPGDAMTVRVRGGNRKVSSGPFTDSAEKMAAYGLIECAGMQEAIDIAAGHPMARAATLEVRPVWSDLPRMAA
ncbi:YciI family protein [Polaromonas sp. CT11-55]|uniref:YciI family protein n=1 Tax=Polaromonas sp. CT11-55 TaxID=3243045 RepID=UPI0039A5400E